METGQEVPALNPGQHEQEYEHKDEQNHEHEQDIHCSKVKERWISIWFLGPMSFLKSLARGACQKAASRQEGHQLSSSEESTGADFSCYLQKVLKELPGCTPF